MKAIIAFALLAVGCFAQTAKVIELPADDAARLQALWKAKQAADEAWETAQLAVKHKLFDTTYACHEHVTCVASGPVENYEYDTSIRFVVPKQYPTSGTVTFTNLTNPCWAAPTGTTNPADLAVHPLGSAGSLRDCINCSPGYLSSEMKGLTK
jgi:hypothetical protein